jgi:hypothetical protein
MSDASANMSISIVRSPHMSLVKSAVSPSVEAPRQHCVVQSMLHASPGYTSLYTRSTERSGASLLTPSRPVVDGFAKGHLMTTPSASRIGV